MRIDRNKDQKGKVKFRLVEFELDGSDATLQESLRNIASAMVRSGNGTATRALPTTHSKPEPDGEATVETAEEEVVEASSEQRNGELFAPVRPRPRKPPTPHVVDIDLTSGPVPLKAFCTEKHPSSETERYLVIAMWLKEHRHIADVDMHHIYTCYRHMGWSTPDDPVQPLRDLKRKRGCFNKGQARGSYSINHIGENVVREMNSVQ